MFVDLCKKLDAGTDEDLKYYFVPTATLRDIAQFNNRKVLAVGLKGMGKSAAYKYFSAFVEDADVTIGITPDKYTLYLPNKNIHFATCRKQFEHDLVIEALRAVVSLKDILKKKVNKDLIDKASHEVKTYMDSLKALAGRFGGISILGCGFTLTKGDVPVLVGMRKEKDIAESLQVLKSICDAGLRIRIVIDDPEQVFSASRDLDTHLIGGLCLAALRLSEAIPQLKIIVLLKTHIYYPVVREVEDLRKYPDHMGRLNWNVNELAELIYARLIWSKDDISRYFSGNEKAIKDQLIRMAREVRNGPRDLLRYVDIALQNANGRAINPSILAKSKQLLSKDSLAELESAHSGKYPRIPEVIKEIFRDYPTKKFGLKELRKHIADLLIKDAEMIALSRIPWMQYENSQTIPRLLFEIGAIALECNGNIILPYEKDYDSEHFDIANNVLLAPTLIEAVS